MSPGMFCAATAAARLAKARPGADTGVADSATSSGVASVAGFIAGVGTGTVSERFSMVGMAVTAAAIGVRVRSQALLGLLIPSSAKRTMAVATGPVARERNNIHLA